MVLKLAEDGRIYDEPIREGEVFLLPLIYVTRRSAQLLALSGSSLKPLAGPTQLLESRRGSR
jgi:hypothetical protein